MQKSTCILSLIAAASLNLWTSTSHSEPLQSPCDHAIITANNEPFFFSGIERDSRFSKNFPKGVKTEHFAVANAGFWVITKHLSQDETVIAYEYSLSVIKPFSQKVWTRSTLENPNSANNPIQYEHFLNSDDPHTTARHSPLFNLKKGDYTLRLDVFADEARTKLVESVTQKIFSPIDNTSGKAFFVCYNNF